MVGTGIEALSAAAAAIVLLVLYTDVFLIEGYGSLFAVGCVLMLFPLSLLALLVARALRGSHGPMAIAALAMHIAVACQTAIFTAAAVHLGD